VNSVVEALCLEGACQFVECLVAVPITDSFGCDKGSGRRLDRLRREQLVELRGVVLQLCLIGQMVETRLSRRIVFQIQGARQPQARPCNRSRRGFVWRSPSSTYPLSRRRTFSRASADEQPRCPRKALPIHPAEKSPARPGISEQLSGILHEQDRPRVPSARLRAFGCLPAIWASVHSDQGDAWAA